MNDGGSGMEVRTTFRLAVVDGWRWKEDKAQDLKHCALLRKRHFLITCPTSLQTARNNTKFPRM